MEDFLWIFILLAFWLFEIAGKAIKRQAGVGDKEPKLSRPDPRVSQRDLARDVDSGARRAEDALSRWEAKQQKARAKPVPSVPAASQRRRIRAADRRRDAFEAIAAMLAAPPEEPAPPQLPESLLPIDRPARRKVSAAGDELPPPASVTVRHTGGMRHLGHLRELQRAVVFREILGPPVSLARGSAFRSDAD